MCQKDKYVFILLSSYKFSPRPQPCFTSHVCSQPTGCEVIPLPGQHNSTYNFFGLPPVTEAEKIHSRLITSSHPPFTLHINVASRQETNFGCSHIMFRSHFLRSRVAKITKSELFQNFQYLFRSGCSRKNRFSLACHLVLLKHL